MVLWFSLKQLNIDRKTILKLFVDHYHFVRILQQVDTHLDECKSLKYAYENEVAYILRETMNLLGSTRILLGAYVKKINKIVSKYDFPIRPTFEPYKNLTHCYRPNTKKIKHQIYEVCTIFQITIIATTVF